MLLSFYVVMLRCCAHAQRVLHHFSNFPHLDVIESNLQAGMWTLALCSVLFQENTAKSPDIREVFAFDSFRRLSESTVFLRGIADEVVALLSNCRLFVLADVCVRVWFLLGRPCLSGDECVNLTVVVPTEVVQRRITTADRVRLTTHLLLWRTMTRAHGEYILQYEHMVSTYYNMSTWWVHTTTWAHSEYTPEREHTVSAHRNMSTWWVRTTTGAHGRYVPQHDHIPQHEHLVSTHQNMSMWWVPTTIWAHECIPQHEHMVSTYHYMITYHNMSTWWVHTTAWAHGLYIPQHESQGSVCNHIRLLNLLDTCVVRQSLY